MTIDIEYNKYLDCIVINATGQIEYKDLTKLAIALIKHKDFRSNINQIFNCSNGELALTMSDLKKIAIDFTQVAGTLGLDRKLALVVSRDLDFGQMRQYEAFFQSGPHVLVHVCRSIDEACDWIKN